MKIIVNKADIGKYFNDSNYLVITDKDIYDYLNGDDLLFGVDCSQSEEKVADTLVNAQDDIDKVIVLHTFNPIILNYFYDDFAVMSFYYQNKSGDIIKFFDNESMQEKLTAMGPGEVVCDTDMQAFVNN